MMSWISLAERVRKLPALVQRRAAVTARGVTAMAGGAPLRENLLCARLARNARLEAVKPIRMRHLEVIQTPQFNVGRPILAAAVLSGGS